MSDEMKSKEDMLEELEELRKKVSELEESEERFRAVMEATTDFVFTKDTECRYTYVNRAMAELFGCRPEDLVGKTPEEAFDPEHAEVVDEVDKQALKGEIADQVRTLRIGEQDRVFHTVQVALEKADGTVGGICGIVREITEQKKADEALVRAAQEWQTTFDATNDAMWILDKDQRILRTNKTAEQLFQLPRGDSVGKHCWEIVHGTEKPIPECPLLRVRNSLHRELMELQIGESWFQVTVDPILDATGGLTGMVHIVTDITERKLAEEALYESQQKYTNIIEHSNELFYIHDTTHRLIYVSPQSEKIMGYTVEEMMRKWTDLVTDNPINDEGLRITEKAIRTGEKQDPYILEMRRRDRTKVFVEIDESPMKDESGTVVGIVGAARDITERIEAAEVLQKSEERYRLLYENVPLPYQALDEDGCLLDVNPFWLTMLGYEREEVIGKCFAEFLHPDSAPSFEDEFPEFKQCGYSHDEQFRIRHKDGHFLDISVEGSISYRPDGSFHQTYCVLQDITERKRAEEALRRYEHIVSSSTDMLALLDNRFNYLAVNTVHAEAFRLTPEQLIGNTVANVFGEEFFNTVIKPYADRCLGGEEVNYEVWVDLPAHGQRYMDVNYYPYYSMDNKIIGFVVNGRDITGKKLAEGEVEQRHKQLLSVFSGIDEVIYVADPETYDLLYMNKPAVENWGDRVGEKCYIVLQDNDSPCSFCSNSEIFGENIGKTHIWEFKNRRNGRLYHCIDRSIQWTDGRSVRLELALDVTDLRKTQEERLELERQILHTQKLESLGVLAGGIAHDFNNILMTILGNADLALQDLSTANPAYANVKEIEIASLRAADLARQMLAYSGKGKFLIEKISLNEAVEEMTHMLEVSISKKAVIKYHLAHNLPLVEADATQIRQIIMNLVTNASDAIDTTSGVISISTGAMDCDSAYLENTYLDESLPEGQYVFVEVTDTGSGMDKEALEKLFDPFYTTKFTGRGLGLSAVLGIIRGHNGAIKVYTELGKGTSFKVLFPVCGESGGVSGPERGGIVEAWAGSGTILLVDDEESILSIGKQMLERMGFDVLTASDGREALSRFSEQSDVIDLVILDLTMPHLDGEETFRELRRIQGDIRVLMTSGYNEKEVVQRFAGKPLAGFLHKPYVLSDLRARIREILEQ